MLESPTSSKAALALQWALVAVLALVALDAAGHDRVSSEDRLEIRTVIARQIEALGQGAAEEAFALAAPGVQRMFETPENFLRTVQSSYRAVYPPASMLFLELRVVKGEVVQRVQLSEDSGNVWMARYSMQRQKDGSWKTNGCHLARKKSISI